MSAFALRKKLLAQQSQVASPSVDEAISKETKIVTPSQKKARKAKTTRHGSVEMRETSPQPSEVPSTQGSFGVVSGPSPSQAERVPRGLSPSSLDEEEQKYKIDGLAQPVSFSSFRPSKTSLRTRSNGVSQLKLEEGEVRFCLNTTGAMC
jgi:hypothetical protein